MYLENNNIKTNLQINPINVIIDYEIWESQEQFNTWLELIVNVFNEIMKMHECSNCSVNLLLTNNETIRELNKNFRNIDKPTNILSFPQINLDHVVSQTSSVCEARQMNSDNNVVPMDINSMQNQHSLEEKQTISNIRCNNNISEACIYNNSNNGNEQTSHYKYNNSNEENINIEDCHNNVKIENIKINNNKAPLCKLKDINIGDLAMSYNVIMDESKVFNKKFFDRCTHLFVHGVLHLLGMDHIEEYERIKMESLEINILKNFFITNPYLVD